jgi:hypothetical protein
MGDFNSMFPNFLTQCLSLKTLLTPIAFLLITGGLIASTIAHHRSGNAQLQAIGKMIVLIMLIVFLPSWGNQIVTIVSDTVTNVLKVDPAKIHDQYQAALQMKKSTDGNTSWWEKLINFPSIMEALVSGVFMILGWFASAIEWWAYILQTAILFMGYSLSPIFIGMLAFPSLQQTGRNYLLNLVGIMIWPLGWGVAGLVTQGMIDFMTDQSFLSSSSAPNTLYSLQNLMGLAFLGIWIIFSTIAAPIAIQRAITTGQSAASSLFSGAASAGRAAATAGATTFAGGGAGGLRTAFAAAAATEAMVNSSLGESGSIIGSLAQMNSRNSGQEGGQSKEKQSEGSPSRDGWQRGLASRFAFWPAQSLPIRLLAVFPIHHPIQDNRRRILPARRNRSGRLAPPLHRSARRAAE